MTAAETPYSMVPSEAALLRQVMQLCQLLHLSVHHCRPARTAHGWRTPIQGDSGFPDLVIAGPQGVLFRELKGSRGRLAAHQQQWCDVLVAAGHDWGMWRPRDLKSGRVEAELKQVAGRAPSGSAGGGA